MVAMVSMETLNCNPLNDLNYPLNKKKVNRNRFKYFLQVNHCRQPVCKTMFLSTLAISDSWVKTAWKKFKNGSGDISPDKREKHAKRGNIIAPEIRESVMEHIQSFPRVESHYIRKTSQREYLEETLFVTKMHELYKSWIEEQKPRFNKVASKRQYQDFFNQEFNISFFHS